MGKRVEAVRERHEMKREEWEWREKGEGGSVLHLDEVVTFSRTVPCSSESVCVCVSEE